MLRPCLGRRRSSSFERLQHCSMFRDRSAAQAQEHPSRGQTHISWGRGICCPCLAGRCKLSRE
eukprot:7779673-Alexandrium_andersonii.AAC.1